MKSSTNMLNKSIEQGLTSADRKQQGYSNRLQYPVPIQVVCKGFTPAHIMIAIRGQTTRAFPQWQPNHLIWYTSKALSQLKSHVRDQHHRF